jgi:guanylate kinase
VNSGKALIFSAPSGAGKTTIVHHLLKCPEFHLSFSVSATSRARRPHEEDGKDYFFVTPEQFREKIRNNEFIEWEEVYTNHYYGTLRTEIERIWAEGKNVIFDVDVVGGLNLKKYFGENSLAVFVQPPSVDVLLSRLRNRSTETPEKIAVRLEKAQHEMTYAPRFDYILINDNLETAFRHAEQRVRQFLRT